MLLSLSVSLCVWFELMFFMMWELFWKHFYVYCCFSFSVSLKMAPCSSHGDLFSIAFFVLFQFVILCHFNRRCAGHIMICSVLYNLYKINGNSKLSTGNQVSAFHSRSVFATIHEIFQWASKKVNVPFTHTILIEPRVNDLRASGQSFWLFSVIWCNLFLKMQSK